MNEEIMQDVDEQLAGALAYDKAAKNVLSQKKILAYILKRTVPEFESVSLDDIANIYIEGTPEVSTVPVSKNKTNAVRHALERQDTLEIKGTQNEDNSITEGSIVFDILFRAKAPATNEVITLIINVEAQKDEPKGYEILNRAIFYVSRLISSQKERDFENSSYNDIKRVYSIWVCMNMEESSMSHVHLTKEDLIGSYEWKGNLDLLNIIMLGLAKNLPEHDETYELHRLLGALLSQELTIDEKLNIIGNEYDIPIEENFRKDVSVMCNLSQGIKEDGIAIGEAGLIMKMYKNGFTAEQIASATDKDIEEVKAIIAGKEPALA